MQDRARNVRCELEKFKDFIQPHPVADKLDFVLPYTTDPCPWVRKVMLEFVADRVIDEPDLIPVGIDIVGSFVAQEYLDDEIMTVGRRIIQEVPKWLNSVPEKTPEMLRIVQKCQEMSRKAATWARSERRKSRDIVRMLELPASKLESQLEEKPGRRLKIIQEIKNMAFSSNFNDRDSLRRKTFFLTFLRKHRGNLKVQIVGL